MTDLRDPHPVRRTPVTASANPFISGATSNELRTQLEDGLERVEALMREELNYSDALPAEATTYLLQAGGKRLRPVLTLLTSRFGENPGNDDVVKAAAAIELTHLASLYHDDVMDEADLRRGVTAAHIHWSNSVAILAGDLLFARSSLMFSDLGEETIKLQADTFERLVLGQLRETVGPQGGADRIQHYIAVLADKTGSLIAAAARCGAICANAPRDYVDHLAHYGEHVGVAFQIADDVIDLSPKTEATGKLAGTDLRAGVETLPVLLLEQDAQNGDADARDLLERIRGRVAGTARIRRIPTRDEATGNTADAVAEAAETGAPAPASDEEIDGIIAELRDHAVTERTRLEAERWVERAIEALEPLPDGEEKTALEQFARTAIERDR